MEFEQGFVIDNDQKAEWAIKKVLEERAERDRLLELVEIEIARLEEQAEDINTRYAENTDYLMTMLNNYAQTVNCKETKTQKTYQLLSGKLVYKMPQKKLTPSESLLEWCKANAPEYVKIEEKVAWGDIKSKMQIVEDKVIFTDTGEMLDCIGIAETEPSFDIK
jgi:hypothetical protein